MTDNVQKEKAMLELDVEFYRATNSDVANLSDAEARAHFAKMGWTEPRLYSRTRSTSEALSQKWLRGKGLEIGGGRRPVSLFGNAEAVHADIAGGSVFGSDRTQITYSLDEVPADIYHEAFDFVIASHVLEHVDGLIAAIQNLIKLVKRFGVIYFVVPDKSQLDDAVWMPHFDINHHIEEFNSPGVHDALHDSLFLNRAVTQLMAQKYPEDAVVFGQIKMSDLMSIIEENRFHSYRFVSHKHGYDYHGWLEIILKITEVIGGVRIIDARYGNERSDCHFILKKL